MTKLQDKILEEVDNKPYLWWRYIDEILSI